jgi:hypothetical protein
VAGRRQDMLTTRRKLGCVIAAIGILIGSGECAPASAAYRQVRIKSFVTYPDARYFGWPYGPSIGWYVAKGYPGPYAYYWDNCVVETHVIVIRKGKRVKLVRHCY